MIEYNYCPLSDIQNLEDYLKTNLGISKSQLKKFLPKKSLTQSFKAKSQIYIPIELLNLNKINPVYTGEEIREISDNSDFLILSKPSKVHSHPLNYNETNNVISFIRSHYPKDYLDINMESYDRGLLYRLDFETSGLIIYLKNEKKFKLLREQFSEMIKTKTYFAKVEGKIEINSEYTHYLKASGTKGSKMLAHDEKSESFNKEAKIFVKNQSYDEASNTSILKVILEQGHRHQIRVQLSHLGFPIIGDSLYGGIASKRLYLHCYSYKIEGNTYTDESVFN